VPTAGHAHCSNSYHAAVAQSVLYVAQTLLIAYATHDNILHARVGELYAEQICQITPAITCVVFSCMLEKSGMQDVKWLNGLIMKQNEAYLAIFCTLKTTSGFIFLLPVV